ncbi:MAG: signal peptidase I [Nostocoides sp.]
MTQDQSTAAAEPDEAEIRNRRLAEGEHEQHEPIEVRTQTFARRVFLGVRELVVVVAMALALSFVVKSWLIQAFYIPSQSMEDTLVKNDRVIVNKLSPNLMRLQRGDVVVFSDPGHWLPPTVPTDHGSFLNGVRSTLIFVGLLPDPSDDHLIKRLIGMPGDHVVCCNAGGLLTVNGQAITEPYVKAGVTPSDKKFDITVPAGRIWVMGDNRSDSEDSRYHDPSGDGSGGSVPIADVTGRALALVWPFDRITWLSNDPATWADVPAPGASPAGSTLSPSMSPSATTSAP